MQKETDNLEFVQGVHFEFFNSSKKTVIKVYSFLMTRVQNFATLRSLWTLLLLSDIAEFYTIYIKHNLFHQNKLGRDIELQNTHIVLFKSPRGMHQFAALSVQLGLGSPLVDWYRDATSVPFGHLLIDLCPQTDDRLRYCTNRGNIQSKTYVPDNLKYLKHLDDEDTLFLYSPSIATLFLACEVQFLKTCPK